MKLTHGLFKHARNFFLEEDAGGGGGGGESQSSGGAPTILDDGPAPEFSVGKDGAFSDGWTKALPADLGDARDKFSKFKTVPELAKSYHELEKALGGKANAVVIPGENAKPEEVAAYRKALGLPETIDKYDIKPETLPEGAEWNAEAAQPYVELGYKLGITPDQMKALVSLNAEQSAAYGKKAGEAYAKQLEEGKQQLKTDWGDEYGAKIDLATRTAKTAGADPRSPGFSDPAVVKAFARLGAMISDDKLVAGGGAETKSAGDRAKDIQTNKANPLYQKYQDGDADTVAMVRALNEQAAKGQK